MKVIHTNAPGITTHLVCARELGKSDWMFVTSNDVHETRLHPSIEEALGFTDRDKAEAKAGLVEQYHRNYQVGILTLTPTFEIYPEHTGDSAFDWATR